IHHLHLIRVGVSYAYFCFSANHQSSQKSKLKKLSNSLRSMLHAFCSLLNAESSVHRCSYSVLNHVFTTPLLLSAVSSPWSLSYSLLILSHLCELFNAYLHMLIDFYFLQFF